MKYITFEHLSNSPQLGFLFVLKQIKREGNLQGFGQGFQYGVKQFKTRISNGDSNMIARASMKSSAILDAN
jgi:hypothetical protein